MYGRRSFRPYRSSFRGRRSYGYRSRGGYRRSYGRRSFSRYRPVARRTNRRYYVSGRRF